MTREEKEKEKGGRGVSEIAEKTTSCQVSLRKNKKSL